MGGKKSKKKVINLQFKEHRQREQEIREMFDFLDIRHKGGITDKDLKKAMSQIGEEFDDTEIQEMMGEADHNLDGVIDFQEFYNLCKRLNLYVVMGGKKSKKKVINLQFKRTELAEYREVFDLFDENGDGRISCDEIGMILKQLNQPVNESEIYEMMDEVDLDASGYLDFGEFLIMMKSYQEHRQREQEIREMFDFLDIRHKGGITDKDLKKAMSQIGEEFDDNEIQEMMGEADHNLDGVIDFQEFYNLCKRLNL